MATLTNLMVLAVEGGEGIPAEHIAAKIAVPIAILIFCGSVFMLLWSNYGARKGALIYSTALFGFCMMLGVFWWFGAPGTPVATGLQNFPGQPADQYTAKWFPFEPGSARAQFFDSTNDLGSNFQPLAQFLGREDAAAEELQDDPAYSAFSGDLDSAASRMAELFLRVEEGESRLGGERRGAYQEAALEGLAAEVGEDNVDDWSRGDPFFTAVPEEVLVTRDQGTLVAGAQFTALANFENEDGETLQVPVDTQPRFAFKQESALWFPSAVWTLVSLVLFVLSLWGLDRVEQREKRALEEVQEPERLAVPIRQ